MKIMNKALSGLALLVAGTVPLDAQAQDHSRGQHDGYVNGLRVGRELGGDNNSKQTPTEIYNWIRTNVPYKSDQDVHGVLHEWETTEQAIKRGASDCEEQASIAVKRLQKNDYKAALAIGDVEFINNRGERVRERHALAMYINPHDNDMVWILDTAAGYHGPRSRDHNHRYVFFFDPETKGDVAEILGREGITQSKEMTKGVMQYQLGREIN